MLLLVDRSRVPRVPCNSNVIKCHELISMLLVVVSGPDDHRPCVLSVLRTLIHNCKHRRKQKKQITHTYSIIDRSMECKLTIDIHSDLLWKLLHRFY